MAYGFCLICVGGAWGVSFVLPPSRDHPQLPSAFLVEQEACLRELKELCNLYLMA